jgi:hypothetical protein
MTDVQLTVILDQLANNIINLKTITDGKFCVMLDRIQSLESMVLELDRKIDSLVPPVPQHLGDSIPTK